MATQPENPAAFPHMYEGGDGMTLRDYFAAHANVTAVDPYRTYDINFDRTNTDVQARYAYADAMLVARATPTQVEKGGAE